MSRVDLATAQLHGSLSDPVLRSIGFLNEIMSRHPDAISLAPGAPYLVHLDNADLGRYLTLGVEHLGKERGLDPTRARRLLVDYGPSRGLINDLVATSVRADLDVDVPADSIVITVGAQEGMLLALRAVMRADKDLLGVVTPCFPGILGAARLLDITVVTFPDHEFDGSVAPGGTTRGPNVDGIRAACQAARSEGRRLRALYLAPDYANPSGTRMSLVARQELLSLARDEDFLLFEDNAYGFTAPPGAELPALCALDPDSVVLIGTFSKVCLPGARVGYVVADQSLRADGAPAGRLADALATLKSMVTVNTSPICQAIVAGLLLDNNGSLAQLGAAQSAHYRANLAMLLAELDAQVDPSIGVSWNRPDGGFFVMMQLPVRADAALLDWCAQRYGVLWTPMDDFFPGGGGEYRIRLSCSYLPPERVAEGVGRLAAFVRDCAGAVPRSHTPPRSRI